MIAMVLAAGLGLRLRPFTELRAKPALEAAGVPLVVRALARVRRAGVERAVVNTHHLPGTVRAAVDAWSEKLGMEVAYSHEPVIQGTAGGLSSARKLLREGPVLVINADVVLDADLPGFLEAHRAGGAEATLLLWDDPRANRYGRLSVDSQGRVVGIPRIHPAPGPRSGMFVGLQVLEPSALDRLPRGPAGIFEVLYGPLLREGRPVQAAWHEGCFLDCGYPAGYLQTCWELLDRRGSTMGLELPRPSGAPVEHPPVAIHRTAQVDGAARLGPRVIVGAGARVPGGVRLQEVVVWSGATVPEGVDWRGGVVVEEGRFVPVGSGEQG